MEKSKKNIKISIDGKTLSQKDTMALINALAYKQYDLLHSLAEGGTFSIDSAEKDIYATLLDFKKTAE